MVCHVRVPASALACDIEIMACVCSNRAHVHVYYLDHRDLCSFSKNSFSRLVKSINHILETNFVRNGILQGWNSSLPFGVRIESCTPLEVVNLEWEEDKEDCGCCSMKDDTFCVLNVGEGVGTARVNEGREKGKRLFVYHVCCGMYPHNYPHLQWHAAFRSLGPKDLKASQ
jgi:hypothetical protein